MSDYKQSKPLIGVSACLLGQAVRYDGTHKRQTFLLQEWASLFDYYSVCPETAIGLGVPRPPIQLVGQRNQPRVLGVDDAQLDVTERLYHFAHEHVQALPPVCGFVLKQGSPSCGVRQVKLFDAASGEMSRIGMGIYARELLRQYPDIPLEDETGLQDAESRERFAERVCLRFRQL